MYDVPGGLTVLVHTYSHYGRVRLAWTANISTAYPGETIQAIGNLSQHHHVTTSPCHNIAPRLHGCWQHGMMSYLRCRCRESDGCAIKWMLGAAARTLSSEYIRGCRRGIRDGGHRGCKLRPASWFYLISHWILLTCRLPVAYLIITCRFCFRLCTIRYQGEFNATTGLSWLHEEAEEGGRGREIIATRINYFLANTLRNAEAKSILHDIIVANVLFSYMHGEKFALNFYEVCPLQTLVGASPG